MSRILISGYYGFNNTGDDTVLYGIISSLKKLDEQIELAALSNKPKETEELFGIAAYNRWNMSEIMREIKKSDLLLMGGGSLLQDATSPRSIIYYLGLVLIAKMMKKPVVFYAQGIGPIHKFYSRKFIKWVVNHVDVITVRDFQSKEDLQLFGIDKAPIYVTADPAITINPEQVSLTKGQEILESFNIDFKKSTIAISVRNWKNEQLFKKELAKMADEFIQLGWNVIFLPMQYPSDIEASLDIVSQMKYQQAVIIDHKMNFKDILSIIANVDFVIGMRLHSIILAAVMNIPFVGISYDPKIDRFVERLDMQSAGHIKNLDYHTLSTAVHKEIKDLNRGKERLKKNMEKIMKDAEKSSILTMEVLQREKTS